MYSTSLKQSNKDGKKKTNANSRSYLEDGAKDVDERDGDEIDHKERRLPLIRVDQGQGHDHQEHQNLTDLAAAKRWNSINIYE